MDFVGQTYADEALPRELWLHRHSPAVRAADLKTPGTGLLKTVNGEQTANELAR